MRIAVSDYDGTLCLNRVVRPGDIAAITRWREAGNLFGIATGRDLSMAMYEIERWNVPFDFLICCNGGISYDADLNVLRQNDIAGALVTEVLDHEAAAASMHYELCRDGVIHLYMRSEDSWFPNLGSPYTPVSVEEARRIGTVQQICLAYTSDEEAERYAEALNTLFGDSLLAHYNKGCLDITAKDVSKATAMLEMLHYREWPRQGLLAVGDGGNDLPMIREFQGFTVHGASEEVQREAREIYAGVGDMLLAHL